MLHELNERSREILRLIVEAYMETGEPIGSRSISRRLSMSLSPATIRNVMADLEESGLLRAPHASAGRLPTDIGLRLFVDGLLELGSITAEERANIETQCQAAGRSLEELLTEATEALSGLSRCAGLVVAPKSAEVAFKHVEFVSLGTGRALVVMVTESGLVENRVIEVPAGMTPSALVAAGNYLNARLGGRTLAEARAEIQRDLDEHRTQLDELTTRVVEAGLATWAGGDTKGILIVRGHANLLDDVTVLGDLERVRNLFDALETRKDIARLIDSTQDAHGVQIFIGAENELFGLTDCSVIVAPYRNGESRFIGAIGVIGPTRINYARIIPMVDYTAKVIGRLLG